MNHTRWFLIQYGFILHNTCKEYKTMWLRTLLLEMSCTKATAEKEQILVFCSNRAIDRSNPAFQMLHVCRHWAHEGPKPMQLLCSSAHITRRCWNMGLMDVQPVSHGDWRLQRKQLITHDLVFTANKRLCGSQFDCCVKFFLRPDGL